MSQDKTSITPPEAGLQRGPEAQQAPPFHWFGTSQPDKGYDHEELILMQK